MTRRIDYLISRIQVTMVTRTQCLSKDLKKPVSRLELISVRHELTPEAYRD